jgi:hypothetical protein
MLLVTSFGVWQTGVVSARTGVDSSKTYKINKPSNPEETKHQNDGTRKESKGGSNHERFNVRQIDDCFCNNGGRDERCDCDRLYIVSIISDEE